MSTKTKTEITFPNYTCDLPIFESITQLENYILTNKKASTGQICGVIIDGETSYYSINADKTTTEVGTSGGGTSIVKYELDVSTTGMGATVTTIATRANATVDGWYCITNDIVYANMQTLGICMLFTEERWWEDSPHRITNITQQPYVLGSNGEDILNLNNGTTTGLHSEMQRGYLVISDSGLNKKITIYGNCSSCFAIKKYTMSGTHCFYMPDYINKLVWYHPDKNNSIIYSNTIGDVINISKKLVDGIHSILETSLIGYYNDGDAGRWGNLPDLENYFWRFTLTASEYAKIADGSLIAGQWLMSTDIPDNALGVDGQFNLRSNGDVYLKSSGTWSYLCNIAPDSGMWKDIIIYPTAMGSGASSPDLITFVSGGLQIYGFDGGSTTEQLFGSFEMQHDYLEGSDLDIHVHWTPTTSAAGNVKWFFEYSIANMGGVFPAPTTISSINSTTGTAWKHIYSDIGATITGTGLKIGHCINFRLYRNPTDADDTYGADAGLLSVGVHYKANTLGSREETAK